jgi:hypothetical protein
MRALITRKANQQQRWLDLALHLQASRPDREDDIQSALAKADFIAHLLHWDADAAKAGVSTKPLKHWASREPYLFNRGSIGNGGELGQPHYELDGQHTSAGRREAWHSCSAVGRLYDKLRNFREQELP